MKEALRGRKFSNDNAVMEALEEFMELKTPQFSADGLARLGLRWKKVCCCRWRLRGEVKFVPVSSKRPMNIPANFETLLTGVELKFWYAEEYSKHLGIESVLPSVSAKKPAISRMIIMSKEYDSCSSEIGNASMTTDDSTLVTIQHSPEGSMQGTSFQSADQSVHSLGLSPSKVSQEGAMGQEEEGRHTRNKRKGHPTKLNHGGSSDGDEESGVRKVEAVSIGGSKQVKLKIKCPTCEKTLRSKAALRVHQKACPTSDQTRDYSSVVIPYDCAECGKIFSDNRKLTRHMATHGSLLSRQHMCTVCSRSFGRPDHLRVHMKQHDDSRICYRCKYCHKEYKTQYIYFIHLAIHKAEEDSTKCDYCGKDGFENKDSLLFHIKVHQGSRTVKDSMEKKYPCPDCKRTFYTEKDVRRHRVSHTKQKDYCCTVCSQRFGRSDHLARHMKRCHNGGKKTSDEVVEKSPYRDCVLMPGETPQGHVKMFLSNSGNIVLDSSNLSTIMGGGGGVTGGHGDLGLTVGGASGDSLLMTGQGPGGIQQHLAVFPNHTEHGPLGDQDKDPPEYMTVPVVAGNLVNNPNRYVNLPINTLFNSISVASQPMGSPPGFAGSGFRDTSQHPRFSTPLIINLSNATRAASGGVIDSSVVMDTINLSSLQAAGLSGGNSAADMLRGVNTADMLEPSSNVAASLSNAGLTSSLTTSALTLIDQSAMDTTGDFGHNPLHHRVLSPGVMATAVTSPVDVDDVAHGSTNHTILSPVVTLANNVCVQSVPQGNVHTPMTLFSSPM